MGLLSDRGNQVTAVDLLGSYDSNRFPSGRDPLVITPQGNHFSVKRNYAHGLDKKPTWFQYEVVGIENDIAVLALSEKPQGTFNDNRVMFLQFSHEKVLDEEGKVTQRLVLKKLGDFLRSSKVSLKDGTVSWERNRKEFSIRLDSLADGH